MFHLKFITEDGLESNVATPMYEVYRRFSEDDKEGMITVSFTTMPFDTPKPMTEMHIGEDGNPERPHYVRCFVTNSEGRTIDRIQHFGKPV